MKDDFKKDDLSSNTNFSQPSKLCVHISLSKYSTITEKGSSSTITHSGGYKTTLLRRFISREGITQTTTKWPKTIFHKALATSQ